MVKKMDRSVFSVREMTYCAVFAALLAICSWISVPLTVPVTLQTFAVFAAIELLGTKCSMTAIAVWIMLGAAGAPVFSGFKGGIGVLSGTTGGYILGFLLCPLVAAGIKKIAGKSANSIPVRAAALLVSLIVCYAFGTAWFVVLYTHGGNSITVWGALKLCVIPFAVFDCIKLGLAVLLGSRVGRFVNLDGKAK